MEKTKTLTVYFLDFINFNADLNQQYLKDKNVEASYFPDFNTFDSMSKVKRPDVVVYNLDLKKDDIAYFYQIKKVYSDIPIILLTSSKTITSGRKLMGEGAFMALRSPINMEEMYHVIQRAAHFAKKGDTGAFVVPPENLITTRLESLAEHSHAMLGTFASTFPDQITVFNDLMLQKIVDMISGILDVEIVSLLLIDPTTGKMVITAQKGLPEDAKRNPSLKVGEGIAGYVAKTGQPILTDDVDKFKHLKIAKNQSQYRTGSFISLPLKVGNRVVGVINVNNKKDGTAFTQEDLLVLEILNAQILLSLRNAQLLYDQKNQYSTYSLLNEIDQIIINEQNPEEMYSAILNKCRSLLNCETLILFMKGQQEGKDILYIRSFLSIKGNIKTAPVLSMSDGIEGMVANVKKPVLISNAEQDTRISEKIRQMIPTPIHNIAAYPVLMFDQFTGIIEAVNKIDEPKFSKEDLFLLKQVTFKVFLGLMKTNLYNEKAEIEARLKAILSQNRSF